MVKWQVLGNLTLFSKKHGFFRSKIKFKGNHRHFMGKCKIQGRCSILFLNKHFVFEQIICSGSVLNVNFIPEQIFCSDWSGDKPVQRGGQSRRILVRIKHPQILQSMFEMEQRPCVLHFPIKWRWFPLNFIVERKKTMFFAKKR